MFNIREQLLEMINARNNQLRLAAEGPDIEDMPDLDIRYGCTGGCGGSPCSSSCKGSCKNSCTRSCKHNSR